MDGRGDAYSDAQTDADVTGTGTESGRQVRDERTGPRRTCTSRDVPVVGAGRRPSVSSERSSAAPTLLLSNRKTRGRACVTRSSVGGPVRAGAWGGRRAFHRRLARSLALFSVFVLDPEVAQGEDPPAPARPALGPSRSLQSPRAFKASAGRAAARCPLHSCGSCGQRRLWAAPCAPAIDLLPSRCHRHRDSALTSGPAALQEVSLSVCCWTLKDLGAGGVRGLRSGN